MSDLQKVPEHLQRQYKGAYGPFHPGDYAPGDEIPDEGEVLWSYLSASRGVVYVVGGWRAFPVEIAASEVKVSR